MFTKCIDSSHMHVKFDNISSSAPKDASKESSGPIFEAHQYLHLFNKYTEGQPEKVSKWEMEDLSPINEFEKKSHIICQNTLNLRALKKAFKIGLLFHDKKIFLFIMKILAIAIK